MAKKQEGPCLFCGGLPCECDGGSKAKSKSSSRVRKSPAKTSDPISPSVEPVKDTEDIFGEIPTQVKPKFDIKPTLEPDRDLSLEYVLSILRPIVHPRDQKLIDKYLKRHYPHDLDRRIAAWKADHETK